MMRKVYAAVKAVTLIEMIIVTIIISTLAALAIPAVSKVREKSMVREAVINLKLIIAAERQYRLNHDAFVFCTHDSSATGCNTLLKTDLNLATSNWSYITIDATSSGVPGVEAKATRLSGDYSGCVYSFRTADAEPYKSGGSCVP